MVILLKLKIKFVYTLIRIESIMNILFKLQHFTTFTLPRKLTKPVYTRPALSPLDFLRFGP